MTERAMMTGSRPLMLLILQCILHVLGKINAAKQDYANTFAGFKVVTECVVPGMVALSYDDGISEYTPQLLKMLKEENVRATFFVLGEKLDEDKKQAKALLKKMWKEGHDIGSHTYNHPDLTSIGDYEIASQMARTDKLIAECLDVCPLFMRPPFGYINQHVVSKMRELGYTVVCWNVDSNDWRMTWSSAAEVAEHTSGLFPPRSSSKKASYILLQHDTVQPSVEAQRQIIRNLKKKGYKFGNMSECLGNASLYSED